MGVSAVGAVCLAFCLDVLFEEFPGRVHPVALFGRAVAPFDREWGHPRAVGVAAALALPAGFAGLGYALVAVVEPLSAPLAALVAGLALFSVTSLRMLLSAARETVGLSDADVEGARESMLALAGRDASSLSPGELRSAAVESAAENLADGLVAPLFAFSLCAQGSLALGVAAAVWVKGVNTLDSMLGYRSKPVGWASARLDDAVMWLPARLSALLLGLAARAPGSLSHARAWASAPPSPNSGWPMATVAAVLDVELSKPGVYTLNRGAGLPDAETASRGVRVVGTAGGLSFLLAGVLVWF